MTGLFYRLRYIALALILACLVSFAFALPANAEAEQPQDTQPGNEACLACHQQPSTTYALPDGSLIDAVVDPAVYGGSVHKSVTCVSCHKDIQGYPHPENAGVQDVRDYALTYAETCRDCHGESYDLMAASVHGDAMTAGNKNAPVCSDCHKPHSQPEVKAATEETMADHAGRIARMCARCHNGVYEEYKTSVHGEGVIDERNPDTPSCTDCHGVHKIINPKSAEFRFNSPEMCAKCHTDPKRMDKYGLSTQVLNTYVADFHGTTITLFDKSHPEGETNKPVCYDCHGVHNIMAVDDPEKGIQVKENMLQVCQKCHPDASENFSASWMSHYIASPDRFPLVFYVQWFYRLFIPGVLGVMGLYVLTDVLRKVGITQRRQAAEKKETEK